MELQVGVKVLLNNPEGKLLLVKRSRQKYPEAKGAWDIVGGRINLGDTLFDNLKREVREETQLELIKEPKLIAAQDILRVPGRHIVRLSYLGEIDGEPVLDEENEEYGWFDREGVIALGEELDIYVKELLDKNLI